MTLPTKIIANAYLIAVSCDLCDGGKGQVTVYDWQTFAVLFTVEGREPVF